MKDEGLKINSILEEISSFIYNIDKNKWEAPIIEVSPLLPAPKHCLVCSIETRKELRIKVGEIHATRIGNKLFVSEEILDKLLDYITVAPSNEPVSEVCSMPRGIIIKNYGNKEEK